METFERFTTSATSKKLSKSDYSNLNSHNVSKNVNNNNQNQSRSTQYIDENTDLSAEIYNNNKNSNGNNRNSPIINRNSPITTTPVIPKKKSLAVEILLQQDYWSTIFTIIENEKLHNKESSDQSFQLSDNQLIKKILTEKQEIVHQFFDYGDSQNIGTFTKLFEQRDLEICDADINQTNNNKEESLDNGKYSLFFFNFSQWKNPMSQFFTNNFEKLNLQGKILWYGQIAIIEFFERKLKRAENLLFKKSSSQLGTFLNNCNSNNLANRKSIKKNITALQKLLDQLYHLAIFYIQNFYQFVYFPSRAVDQKFNRYRVFLMKDMVIDFLLDFEKRRFLKDNKQYSKGLRSRNNVVYAASQNKIISSSSGRNTSRSVRNKTPQQNRVGQPKSVIKNRYHGSASNSATNKGKSSPVVFANYNNTHTGNSSSGRRSTGPIFFEADPIPNVLMTVNKLLVTLANETTIYQTPLFLHNENRQVNFLQIFLEKAIEGNTGCRDISKLKQMNNNNNFTTENQPENSIFYHFYINYLGKFENFKTSIEKLHFPSLLRSASKYLKSIIIDLENQQNNNKQQYDKNDPNYLDSNSESASNFRPKSTNIDSCSTPGYKSQANTPQNFEETTENMDRDYHSRQHDNNRHPLSPSVLFDRQHSALSKKDLEDSNNNNNESNHSPITNQNLHLTISRKNSIENENFPNNNNNNNNNQFQKTETPNQSRSFSCETNKNTVKTPLSMNLAKQDHQNENNDFSTSLNNLNYSKNSLGIKSNNINNNNNLNENYLNGSSAATPSNQHQQSKNFQISKTKLDKISAIIQFVEQLLVDYNDVNSKFTLNNATTIVDFLYHFELLKNLIKDYKCIDCTQGKLDSFLSILCCKNSVRTRNMIDSWQGKILLALAKDRRSETESASATESKTRKEIYYKFLLKYLSFFIVDDQEEFLSVLTSTKSSCKVNCQRTTRNNNNNQVQMGTNKINLRAANSEMSPRNLNENHLCLNSRNTTPQNLKENEMISSKSSRFQDSCEESTNENTYRWLGVFLCDKLKSNLLDRSGFL